MTDYFCPKCDKVTSHMTDLSMHKNKKCKHCSTMLIPKSKYWNEFWKKWGWISKKK